MKYIEKILKSIVFVFVFSIVLLSNASSVRAESYMRFDNKIKIIDTNSVEFQKSIEDAFKEKYGENYKEIILENSKSAETSDSFDLKYYNKVTNTITYPIDFGGKYINDNNKLVIQIVKNLNLKSKTQNVIDSISDDYIIEYVDNSYNDLENINNEIIKYYQSNNATNDYLTANYIDVINNVVVVELKNNSLEEQRWFKENVIDSSLIKFTKNDKSPADTTSYNAGGALSNYCSMAYRARVNGNDGFITAAHCVKKGETILGYGTVTEREYGGDYDGAFVKFSPGNSMTNNIEWGYYPSTAINTTTNPYPSPYTVGTIIAKSGLTTKATVGKITNVSYSYTNSSNGVYFSNLIYSSAKCNNGDSGGLVYKPGTSVDKTGTVVGIVKAKANYSGDDNPGDLVFSRSDKLNQKFGATRY